MKIQFHFLVSAFIIGVTSTSVRADTLVIPQIRADEKPKATTSVTALVSILTSPELPWEERFQAEIELTRHSDETVLLALIPEIAKGRPGHGGIWNGSGSARSDARFLPPVQQVFYAVHRVWNSHDLSHLKAKPLPVVGRALVAYLPKAASPISLLSKLGNSRTTSHWVKEAEEPVLAIFRDPANDMDVRLAALKCLVRHTGKKYYGEAKTIARSLPEQPWQQLNEKIAMVGILRENHSAEKAGAATREVDPELLELSFSLLAQAEKNGIGHGYFLATDLEGCVGQNFAPDQRP